MPRLMNWFFILSFMVVLGIPSVWLVTKGQLGVSRIEKRDLNQLPAMPGSSVELESWPGRFEAFFSDQFGLRDTLAYVHNRIKFRLGQSPNPQSVIGSKDWFFYNPDNVIDIVYRNVEPLSERQLLDWKQSIEAKHRWFRQQGISYLFVIAPSKFSIYGEHLPDRFRTPVNPPRHDQLFDYLNANAQLPLLDLRPALRAAKGNHPLYFKTDTHWNLLGANVAQYEIMQNIPGLTSKFNPYRYEDNEFKWVRIGAGDIVGMINLRDLINEASPEFRKKKPDCPKQFLLKKDYYPRRYMGAVKFTCGNPNGLKAVIFRDSFFSNLVPYISYYFDEVLYIWRSPVMKDLEIIIKENKPDVVIEEHVERILLPLEDEMKCLPDGPLRCPE